MRWTRPSIHPSSAVAVSWDTAGILSCRGSLDATCQLIECCLSVSGYSQADAFEESFVAGFGTGDRLRVTLSGRLRQASKNGLGKRVQKRK